MVSTRSATRRKDDDDEKQESTIEANTPRRKTPSKGKKRAKENDSKNTPAESNPSLVDERRENTSKKEKSSDIDDSSDDEQLPIANRSITPDKKQKHDSKIDDIEKSDIPLKAQDSEPDNRGLDNQKKDTSIEGNEQISSTKLSHNAVKSTKAKEKPDSTSNQEKDGFSILVDNLQSCASRDLSLSMHCRELMALAYQKQTSVEFQGQLSEHQFLPKKRKGKTPLGPLPTVEIDPSFDPDQLWEEIELRNKPLISFLQKQVYKVARSHSKKQTEKAAEEKIQLVDDADPTIPTEPTNTNDDVPLLDHDETVDLNDFSSLDQRRQLTRDVVNNESTPEVEKKSPGTNKKRVRFSLDPVTESQKMEKETTDTSDALEDGFFNIEDMELFADEAESLAKEGKLVASDDESNADGPDSDDPDDGDDSETEHEERIRYSDFFDKPKQPVNKNQMSKTAKTNKLLDELDEEVEEAEEAEEREQTPFEKARGKERANIDALEEANIQKRSWALRGEISAFARPKDSLLDAEVEHDMAVKPKGFHSNETTSIIEDVIKQRITDNLFDDVIMALPEDYEAKKRGKGRDELPEISQDRPTEGLADMYAKEFTEETERKKREILASNEVQKERDEPETAEQREVNTLFEKLSQKLDALSSLHFTPLTRVLEETSVKPNTKALAAEEAIPENVSDGNLLTAREVYSVSKDKQNSTEGTKDDRKSARRRRKTRRKKKNAVVEERKNILAQNDPALAEKRKAEMALQRRGKKAKLDTSGSGLVQVVGKK